MCAFVCQCIGNIDDGSNAKVAADHYHRYPEDLDLMKDLGVNSYRFSLSWARILPKGRFGDVNMKGIDHYNRMINAILERGGTKRKDSSADRLAAERAQAFYMTWFLDPVVYGRYPKEMQEILGEDLPEFSKDDLKSFKTGLDYIGINQYTGGYAKDCLHSECEPGKGGSRAEGMEKVLMYATERYKNIPLYVTENGYGENITGVLLNDNDHDHRSIKFMRGYLDAVKRAMRRGADVRGYFIWSLLDNFEWVYGYTSRFGLYHVDFDTLERTPRLSASWYKNFIFKNRAQSKDADA
ncbi:unnamed protein product [Microthlaspi erraticum]|uniref:Thioglucosidase n=1 Tax=Microthlaspi erraticum TaxID=1685480 RepID=A0A6D2KJQ0_9BRAS|nr:unnamed protein product [Microthlaspi erraticum]